jgi:hypothetical protein
MSLVQKRDKPQQTVLVTPCTASGNNEIDIEKTL